MNRGIYSRTGVSRAAIDSPILFMVLFMRQTVILKNTVMEEMSR